MSPLENALAEVLAVTQPKPTPLAPREGATEEQLSVERDIGRIEGTLAAHKEQIDKAYDAVAKLAYDCNARFDGFQKHLDGQDEKLDVLVRRSDREDGADGAQHLNFENSYANWSKWCAIAVAVATLAQLGGHWLIIAVSHVIGAHP